MRQQWHRQWGLAVWGHAVRVYLIPARAIRPGPRCVEGRKLLWLCSRLHEVKRDAVGVGADELHHRRRQLAWCVCRRSSEEERAATATATRGRLRAAKRAVGSYSFTNKVHREENEDDHTHLKRRNSRLCRTFREGSLPLPIGCKREKEREEEKGRVTSNPSGTCWISALGNGVDQTCANTRKRGAGVGTGQIHPSIPFTAIGFRAAAAAGAAGLLPRRWPPAVARRGCQGCPR